MVAVEIVAAQAAGPLFICDQSLVRNIDGILLQPGVFVTVPAIVEARNCGAYTPMLEVARDAGLGVYGAAGVLETGLVKAKHRVSIRWTIMTGQALGVTCRLQPEIGLAGAQAEQMARIGLYLLAQAAACGLVAVLAAQILVTCIHRTPSMQHLSVWQQEHGQSRTADADTEDQGQILAQALGYWHR
ncbi:MAG: hypothetical protein R3E82_03875 [Pseudomonadales bacterium]